MYDPLYKTGLKIKRRYIRKMGNGKTQSYFYINATDTFAAEISAGAQVMEETKLCNPVDYGCNLSFDT